MFFLNKRWWLLRAYSFLGRRIRESCVAPPPKGRLRQDQSRVDSLILKDELKVCSRSKRNLSLRLCETETNMLAIISNYQAELNLATAHEYRVVDEHA